MKRYWFSLGQLFRHYDSMAIGKQSKNPSFILGLRPQSVTPLPFVTLTLLTGLFEYISTPGRGGGSSWDWVGLGFQFFLEMTYLGGIYHIQKD